MSTSRDFTEYVLDKLKNRTIFTVKSMFGEYALYANSKVVGLICDNTLYVKILPESLALEEECEKDTPYPGAKMYYVVVEEQLFPPRKKDLRFRNSIDTVRALGGTIRFESEEGKGTTFYVNYPLKGMMNKSGDKGLS